MNTLWVDKKLKMHGLMQAFSRTNRILNIIKTFENIVCFWNLQKRVDSAISLFGATRRMRNLLQSFDDFKRKKLISERDLQEIITTEKLKPLDTRKFMENAFRDGEIKTAGTDIDKIMPPISRFGGGGCEKKKQGIIDKLKAFFEKYFGIGGSSTFTDSEQKTVPYDTGRNGSFPMVAEPKTPYGEE